MKVSRALVKGLIVGSAVVSFGWVGTGCVSLGGQDEKAEKRPEPPKITEDMALDTALVAAIDYGVPTLDEVKRLVTQRKEWPEAQKLLWTWIKGRRDSYSAEQLLNAVHLYRSSQPKEMISLVTELTAADRPVVRQIGWQMAASHPSSAMRSLVDRLLTDAVVNGQEEDVLLPEMARAVYANGLKSSYTLLRQGLMTVGADDFAKAMIASNPEQASQDFMDYLALAPLEDLRQLNQRSVNMYTCLVIMRHYMSHPAPVNHPKFESLFLFAVSRNQALSEMAVGVIERALPRNRDYLAYLLARLPLQVQIAFIEDNRRNPDPNITLFFADLKKTTAHREVVEEIDALAR